MKHVVLLPERWQLGDVISVKVRRVPSIKADRLTVCCSPNQRWLYPTATDFFDVAEDLDGWAERQFTKELLEMYPQAEHIKISRAFEEVPDFQVTVPQVWGTPCDVMVAPRRKDNSSPHRNWSGWSQMTERLIADGVCVFSMGGLYDSENVGAYKHIHDLAHIAAHMRKTKLVVATDSGLAHLAILLRVPLAVIWSTPVGVIPGQDYTKGCHGRMEAQKRSPVWHIEGGWEDHDKAFQEVKKILCEL